MEPLSLLAGLTVLELGDGVAGAASAGLLAQLGAEVTKVVTTPRRIADHVPAARDVRGEHHGLLASVLDRGKRLVEAGNVGARSADSTIVIDDRVDGAGDDLVAHLRDVAARNRSVWVTVSPYGLDGPRSGRPGGQLVAEAAGGLLATIEPVGGGRPTSPPGFVALRAVGTVAALASLHGLDRFRDSGVPVHVDVSAQEAVVFTGSLPECAHLVFRCPGRAGSGRYVAPSGLFPCRDGLVRIAAIEDHQWKGMVACLGAPEWTNGLETRPARAEHAAMITERVREWSAQQLKAECGDLLQRNGVPSTPVNGPVELLESPQFASRGFLSTDVDADGVVFTAPGAPWVTSVSNGATSDATASTRPGRVRGTRILELTHVLAGPIVGSLLGAMGADVVRLEDERRLDIYRRTGPFADGIAGPERGAYFAVANFSKRSVLGTPEDIDGIVAALLERSDVVIENVGQSRLDRLGVDPLALRDDGSAVLHVSGFGSNGPLADYKVYANNVQAYGGLAHLTRTTEGELAHLGTVLADPLSSVIGATVLAAWALGPMRSTGVDLDLSMSEVVATLVGEFVAEASLSSDITMASGTTLAPYAPHSVFACRDDRWLALAVQSDAQWHQLLDALDHPQLLQRPEWSQEAKRWRDREKIERVLADLFADADIEDLDATFAAAGVPASVVNRASDLLADPHLAARTFFPRFDHPDADVDDARLVGVPWRMAGEGPVLQSPPPRLGGANAELFPQGARS
jgi:crotonobetainyl-CoA:carnitine CoA-transferase CaiB-like acyl-CoA transferase